MAIDFEGYCVKCRKKVKVRNGILTKTSRGRPIAKGLCPTCKTKITWFLK